MVSDKIVGIEPRILLWPTKGRPLLYIKSLVFKIYWVFILREVGFYEDFGFVRK